ncbi:hypothetical protein ACQB60_29085 [Actinomycetota bacterium Odt1-20B]
MPLWFQGLFAVGLAVALAHLTLFATGRLFPADDKRSVDNTIISAALGTIGGAYALLLSFTISVVWHNYADTQAIVAREANAVADLERMSRGFSLPVQREVQDASRTYMRLTVDEEWALLAEGRSSVRADASLVELWHVYTEMPPADRSSSLYSQSLTRLNEVGDNRRMRLLTATESIPTVIVFLLYAGAAVTMTLTCLYSMKSRRLHRVLLTFLAAILSFGLFLISSLDQPFGTKLPISPEPLRYVLAHMQQLEY